MKITLKKESPRVKFSELKPGDTFLDPDSNGPEIKIEYSDIHDEFADFEPDSNHFASVSLETGNVFFYINDFYVIPIKLNAVEE